jgi:hypothetical protein
VVRNEVSGKFTSSSGRQIIILEVGSGQDIGRTPIKLIWVPVKDFIDARNVSYNADHVINAAEEKLRSVSKEESRTAA